jgi:hypothetical protein
MMSGDDDNGMLVDDPKFPSPPPKRWRVYCDGELVEAYDSAREAWEGYMEHKEKILPVLLKTLKRAKGVYSFRDSSRNVGFLEFRKIAQGGK